MPFFFFRELQLMTVLLLISDTYMSWSANFVSLKLYVGFSNFDSISILLQFIFLFSNCEWTHRIYNIMIPLKISFAPRPLIFKLQQVVLKFNDIYVSWSSPKIDLETNFLNLENRRFENVNFSQ